MAWPAHGAGGAARQDDQAEKYSSRPIVKYSITKQRAAKMWGTQHNLFLHLRALRQPVAAFLPKVTPAHLRLRLLLGPHGTALAPHILAAIP